MTVITMTTKSDSFVKKDETHIFNNITKIVEKDDVIELIRNGNYAGVINTKNNRIIAVEW